MVASRVRYRSLSEASKLEKLYVKYRNKMFHWAICIVKDKEKAEDIVKSVMVQVSKKGFFNKLDKMGETPASDYLEAMIKTMAHNWEKEYKKPSETLRPVRKALSLFQKNSRELRKRSKSLSREELASGVRQLTEVEVNLLALKYVDGFTNKEISQIIGIRKAIIRRRIAETEVKLKTRLEGGADIRKVVGNEQ